MKQHTNKIVLPLLLYFDDFDPGNVCGSHAGKNKIGETDISIPCLPPKYASKLEFILPTLFFKPKDRSVYQNQAVFQPVIDHLNNLQNKGIEFITKKGKKERVYFELALIVGDNLGLHSMLGLVESFSATFSCRYCLSPKETRILLL